MITTGLRFLRALLSAYTMKTLWWWFAVPLGLPGLSLAHAYGLDALVSWVVMTDLDNMVLGWKHPIVVKHWGNHPHTLRAMTSMGLNLIFLATGYLAHILMQWGY